MYGTERLGELFRSANPGNIRAQLAEALLIADGDDVEQAGYVEGLVKLFMGTYPGEPIPGIDDAPDDVDEDA